MAVRFMVAERFGRWPWELDDVPFDELVETIRLMGYIPPTPVEAVIRR